MDRPKAFLVLQTDFYYTDEYMAPLSEEGICTNPQKIFFDEGQAKAYAFQHSWKLFSGQPLGNWGLGLDMITSLPARRFYQNLKSVLPEFELPSDLEDPDYCIWDQLWFDGVKDPEQQRLILSWCDQVKLFEVVPAQIEDENLLKEAAKILSGEVHRFELEGQSAIRKYLIPETELDRIAGMFGLKFEPNPEVF
ncbi:hypothetical protein [Deinococcus misasensis]|uniref:hypothetical protein n=1 Tax=Deinococcus misasensis TaxID=392413 RepID=UPI0005595ABE|nr:hypothetical protein [Deinococcus misasensis]